MEEKKNEATEAAINQKHNKFECECNCSREKSIANEHPMTPEEYFAGVIVSNDLCEPIKLVNTNDLTLTDKNMCTYISHLLKDSVPYVISHYDMPIRIDNTDDTVAIYTDGKLCHNIIMDYSVIIVLDSVGNKMHVTLSSHASIDTIKSILNKIYTRPIDGDITVVFRDKYYLA